jgi:hypothetical protein
MAMVAERYDWESISRAFLVVAGVETDAMAA